LFGHLAIVLGADLNVIISSHYPCHRELMIQLVVRCYIQRFGIETSVDDVRWREIDERIVNGSLIDETSSEDVVHPSGLDVVSSD
jgi:hypothetical protein